MVPLFDYVTVADVLKKYAKFDGLVEAGSRRKNESTTKRSIVVSLKSEDDITAFPYRQRISGIKAIKKADVRKKRNQQVTNKLADISDGLNRSIDDLKRIVVTQEMSPDQGAEYILLQVLPSGSARYNTMLQRSLHCMGMRHGVQHRSKAGNAQFILDANVAVISEQLNDSDG